MLEREFRGKKFLFNETPSTGLLCDEIFSDNYKVFENGLSFGEGDVILDLGACEGVFSILMAKLFPQARIIALEPVVRTYHQMMRNIGLNGVTNIEAVNVGVGRWNRKIDMVVSKDHSGGSSFLIKFNETDHLLEPVTIITLDELFDRYKLNRVKLMKIDIEGMEYDALYYSDVLDRVECLAGEFHFNYALDFEGRRVDGLANWVGNRTKVLHLEAVRMAD